MNFLTIITPIAVAAIGGVVTYLTAVVGKRGVREDNLINQYQEAVAEYKNDRKEYLERITLLETRMRALEEEILELKTREGVFRFHIGRLEDQVEDLGGTPLERPDEIKERKP